MPSAPCATAWPPSTARPAPTSSCAATSWSVWRPPSSSSPPGRRAETSVSSPLRSSRSPASCTGPPRPPTASAPRRRTSPRPRPSGRTPGTCTAPAWRRCPPLWRGWPPPWPPPPRPVRSPRSVRSTSSPGKRATSPDAAPRRCLRTCRPPCTSSSRRRTSSPAAPRWTSPPTCVRRSRRGRPRPRVSARNAMPCGCAASWAPGWTPRRPTPGLPRSWGGSSPSRTPSPSTSWVPAPMQVASTGTCAPTRPAPCARRTTRPGRRRWPTRPGTPSSAGSSTRPTAWAAPGCASGSPATAPSTTRSRAEPAGSAGPASSCAPWLTASSWCGRGWSGPRSCTSRSRATTSTLARTPPARA